MSDLVQCPHCGIDLSPEVVNCYNCGTKVDSEPVAESTETGGEVGEKVEGGEPVPAVSGETPESVPTEEV